MINIYPDSRVIKNISKKSFYLFFITLFFILFPKSSQAEDFFKRDLKIPIKVNRIVSLSPATTEILFALGLDKNIVGVTNDCNYPAQALSKTKTGKFGFINLEKVISLKPDIIIATSDMNKQLDLLKKYNVPLIALKTTDIDSIYKNINYIGKITHTENKALAIKIDYEKQIKAVKQKAKSLNNPSLFYCVWHDPLITSGNGSFINDIIKISGANNIAGNVNSSFIKYSTETLIAKNPEYIFIPNTTYQKIDFSKLPWNSLKAVKNKKIYSVNDDLYLRPAPRIIYAIKEMQNLILKK